MHVFQQSWIERQKSNLIFFLFCKFIINEGFVQDTVCMRQIYLFKYLSNLCVYGNLSTGKAANYRDYKIDVPQE